MKEAAHMLEVYLPGSADHLWVAFSSHKPFVTISRGDIVNPGVWEGSEAPMKVLRVLNVEHVIWETDTHVTHKVMVFTEEVEGTRELRLKGD